MIKSFLHFIKYFVVSHGNICYTPSEVELHNKCIKNRRRPGNNLCILSRLIQAVSGENENECYGSTGVCGQALGGAL